MGAHAVRVWWEGAQFAWHSLAHVNRELCLALLRTGRISLSLVPTEPDAFAAGLEPRFRALEERFFAPLPPALDGRAAVHVRHAFPPRFEPPPDGRLVLMQPWEYGFIPAAWVAPIRETVSEVWCYSDYVRQVYLDSGIEESRLRRVPLGVNVDIFRPEAPPFVPTTEPGAHRLAGGLADRFVFLFAGGTLHRKGIDIVLDAYLRAFSALDPVCLLIKDTGGQTVYRGQTAREQILELAADPTRPPIVYLEQDLTAHELAGVYTAAHCGVQPYRGEGYCLPAVEALGCGRPVIATAGGPTDDFLDDAVGWRLPAERRLLPGGKVGGMECAGPPWMLEPSVPELAALMREVSRNPEEAARRGSAGLARVRKSWTWAHAAAAALAGLDAVSKHEATAAGSTRARRQQRRRKGRTSETAEPSADQAPVGHWSLEIGHSPKALRLSLCMIVLNEERVLADCLRTLAPWVDEIIIVDTGSTDRTVEIAKSSGAKVFHFTWCDDFAAARNESLRHATGDWILWVDADDTLPFSCGEEIRRLMYGAPPEIMGFVIPVQFLEDGGRVWGTRVDHVKLFRNVPGLEFEYRIHEQVLASIGRAGGQVARCGALVMHSGYDTSPEGQARKRARDRKLLALELEEHPENPFMLFCMGMTENNLGEHEKAVAWLRRSIQVSGPGESHVRKAYALMAGSLRALGRMAACEEALREGLETVPGDPELHFVSAGILTELGRLREAKEHYLQLREADSTAHFSSVDQGILGYKTFHNLGGVCRALGENAEARDWLLKAIQAAPTMLHAAFDLFDLSLEMGDAETAEQALGAVRAVEGEGPNWLAMRDRQRAGAPRANGASQPAGPTDGRITELRKLLETGREDEAVQPLRSLSEAGVAEAAYFLGVHAVRHGRLPEALGWMERALALNPGHETTRGQVENLRRAVAGG